MKKTSNSTSSAQSRSERARYRRWVVKQIGPRRVGGICQSGYSGDIYEVLEIDPGPRDTWPTWQIAVRTLGTDEIRRHSTAWEDRDRVIAQPEDEDFATAWAAWAVAHDCDPWLRDPDNPENAEWRHLLDELAHPATTQAFQRLAPA